MNTDLNGSLSILVVEDSDEDFDVLELTFANLSLKNDVIRCTEGGAVVPLLERLHADNANLPGFILLDLNLIGIDGREVLRRLKSSPVLRQIPVIVFSTSSNKKDVDLCYQSGAASYVVKPVNLEKLELFVEKLKGFWLETAILPRTS